MTDFSNISFKLTFSCHFYVFICFRKKTAFFRFFYISHEKTYIFPVVFMYKKHKNYRENKYIYKKNGERNSVKRVFLLDQRTATWLNPSVLLLFFHLSFFKYHVIANINATVLPCLSESKYLSSIIVSIHLT